MLTNQIDCLENNLEIIIPQIFKKEYYGSAYLKISSRLADGNC